MKCSRHPHDALVISTVRKIFDNLLKHKFEPCFESCAMFIETIPEQALLK